jgi:DNA-binding CsgD family transcriptional regulator
MPTSAPTRLPHLRDALAAVLAHPGASGDVHWAQDTARALGVLLQAAVTVRLHRGGPRARRDEGDPRPDPPRPNDGVVLVRRYPVDGPGVVIAARLEQPSRSTRLRARRVLDALAPAFETAALLRSTDHGGSGYGTLPAGGAVLPDATIRLPTAADAPSLTPAALASLDAALRAHFGLTRRQIEVTRLLLVGTRNADIAEILGVSEATARHHTERVLARLGARSRAEVPRIVGARVATAPPSGAGQDQSPS